MRKSLLAPFLAAVALIGLLPSSAHAATAEIKWASAWPTGAGACTVMWGGLRNTTGSHVMGYRIESGPQNAAPTARVTVSSSTWSELLNFGAYQSGFDITVTPLLVSGTGKPKRTGCGTSADPSTVPGLVRDVRWQRLTSGPRAGSLVVSWLPAAGTTGATGYVVWQLAPSFLNVSFSNSYQNCHGEISTGDGQRMQVDLGVDDGNIWRIAIQDVGFCGNGADSTHLLTPPINTRP